MEYKKHCKNCSKKYKAATKRSEFCSDYCRVQWNREQKKNKPATKKKAAVKVEIKSKAVAKPKKSKIKLDREVDEAMSFGAPASKDTVKVSFVPTKFTDAMNMAKNGDLTKQMVQDSKFNSNQKSMLYAKITAKQ